MPPPPQPRAAQPRAAPRPARRGSVTTSDGRSPGGSRTRGGAGGVPRCVCDGHLGGHHVVPEDMLRRRGWPRRRGSRGRMRPRTVAAWRRWRLSPERRCGLSFMRRRPFPGARATFPGSRSARRLSAACGARPAAGRGAGSVLWAGHAVPRLAGWLAGWEPAWLLQGSPAGGGAGPGLWVVEGFPLAAAGICIRASGRRFVGQWVTGLQCPGQNGRL